VPPEIFRTISEQVADRVRREIMSGELEEGVELKEQTLSDRFGVSRGTVRHALMDLAREGIVVPTPNVGMKVASHPSLEVMSLIVSMRRQIEAFVLRTCFAELREHQMVAWRELLIELGESGDRNDLNAFIDADVRFHRFIVELHPDRHILDLWEAIRARMMMRYNRLKSLHAGYEEHRAIVEAVESGDLEEAIELLNENIT
jgi:GntR family transcriptional regulator, rspAB operon transcriptional repressor